jgi:hypothetical protein
MVVGSAYVHLYQKVSIMIFYGTMEETGVEGIALYHH